MAGEQYEGSNVERGKGGGHIVLWPFFALVVYVLSVGPAALLHEKTNNARLKKVFELTYAPVEVIEETPLESVVEWWIRLWFRLGSDGH